MFRHSKSKSNGVVFDVEVYIFLTELAIIMTDLTNKCILFRAMGLRPRKSVKNIKEHIEFFFTENPLKKEF